ncbi:MAG: D-glycero-beta-D-manno-heptose-7-phosphate kinase [Alphaproteobacteria bacterium]|jgi:D-beta-D-heptose 7-phosphate kinase/D-beta-D-heptose 1-phosphate adenosyltransferase|nr:D-glycero-beta-D-manno-heptose-7-phosphate kinase [Alphaproteobacteria bacterium]MDP7456595.1 D-glycero-beta-D-manno-heptose-7-phosphate kinase [Alphaproteobacteria bacterium]HJO88832.1 D-glycero-beta-D-manno-heptose-7-phosphate kinase [Alphaproteobacteria bacterium]|tara:strand:- start:809 stop:2278 length:1470 start_codon:yes stop_codon:yes gene_type:complete
MSDIPDPVAAIDLLGNARVLCIGDLMLDRFVMGDVERISPEAPIPVFRVGKEIKMLGGAGNVARNLSALGTITEFIATVGDDTAAKEVKELFRDEPATTPHLLVNKDQPTSIKTRFVAENQQMMRVDREIVLPLSQEKQKKILDLANKALKRCGVLVLSDYGKGVLTPSGVENLIITAAKAERPVIVDPKGDNFTCYRGASLITPNLRELAAATHMPVSSDEEIATAACAIIASCGVDAVLVTRSADGMTLVRSSAKNTPEHFAGEAREVFDVSGAGDTAVATLAAAIAVGVDLSDAARLANVAAGISVGKAGTAVVHGSELLGALRHQDLLSGEAKIVSLAEALERVSLWHSKDLKIGFTNGCFDLLHPGHISLLDQAKAACDRLIVGINSDSSTTRLKGRDRPVQPESARETVLASLAAVDLVVVFSEDTPIRMIEAIRPDVLIKGADYHLDEVVGGDVVQSYGGRILLAEIEPGYSTTSTIERIAK